MARSSIASELKSALGELRLAFRTSRREALRESLGSGRETPDPVPHARFSPDFAPSFDDRIREFIRNEVSAQAADDGFETWEEADDFAVDEDGDDFLSPYVLSEHQLSEELPLPESPPVDPSPGSEDAEGGIPEGGAGLEEPSGADSSARRAANEAPTG